jgi:preprotein translocase subunit SecA
MGRLGNKSLRRWPSIWYSSQKDNSLNRCSALSTTTSVTTATEISVAPSPSRASGKNRLGSRWANWLRRLFGTPSQRRLARGALYIDAIRHWESEFGRLTDAEILSVGNRLRGRARGGESLDRLLPEVFGLVCVAAMRKHGMRPYDVQLAAGVVLHDGALAEVATGEGKTLVATCPVALNAMVGKGVHVTTVNDYLARRDAEWTAYVYNAIGLSVGYLQMKMPDDARTAAYRNDITYGTASEFGFDFLRDRLKVKSGQTQGMPFWAPWSGSGHFDQQQDPKVQREHHYAVVDEADNIFIDEARTPLIISAPTRQATEPEQVVYHWANELARAMRPGQHFLHDEKKQKFELTDEGRQTIRYSKPPIGQHSHAMDKLHEHVERALHANYRFRLDQHYMIEDGKVVIIDEFTGRRMPDRHWREGLHQAVEAKEKVPVTLAADHAAQITFQSYFRLYTKLSGMTGTGAQNFWEIRRVYKIWVVCVPTNRPCVRVHMPDRVFPTEEAKFDAIAEEIKRLHTLGRPVLVGTRSVEKSELLGKKLVAAGIPHQVLNARPDIADREADIVAQAGRLGAVTIATNMAGRGTDILLGGNPEALAWSLLKDKFPSKRDVPEEVWKQAIAEIRTRENMVEESRKVADTGGLHVLGTERHEASRIDRQLQGRSARQGDPGSCQFFLALDDELLEGLGPRRQESMKQKGKRGGSGWEGYQSEFMRAQRRLEKRHYRQRVDLMIYERNRQEILKDLGADPYVD